MTKKRMLSQMDQAVDLIDRYHAATNKRCYVTDKLTSIILGNDETDWLVAFEDEVKYKENEAQEMYG